MKVNISLPRLIYDLKTLRKKVFPNFVLKQISMVTLLVSVIEVNVSLFTPKVNSISEEQVPMDCMLKVRDHIAILNRDS